MLMTQKEKKASKVSYATDPEKKQEASKNAYAIDPE